jgi:hypothetical protein
MWVAKRDSPEQIVNILRQIEASRENRKKRRIAWLEFGITVQTYYR